LKQSSTLNSSRQHSRSGLPARLTSLFLALLLTVFTLAVFAPANAQDEFDTSGAKEELDLLQTELGNLELEEKQLQGLRDRALNIKDMAATCIDRQQPELNKLQSEIELLGEIDDDVDIEIWESRNLTLETYNRLATSVKNCELAAARSDRIIVTVEERFKELSAKRLSTRDYTVLDTIKEAPQEMLSWSSELSDAMVPELSEDTDTGLAIWSAFIALIVGALAGIYLRRQYQRNTLTKARDSGPLTDGIYLLTPFYKRVPLILGAFFMAASLIAISEPPYWQSLPIRFAVGLMVYGFGLFLIDWCTGTSSPVGKITGANFEKLRPLRRRFRYLIFALLASLIVLGPFWLGVQASDKFRLIRLVAVLATVIPLYMILGTASRYDWLTGRFRAIRTLAFIALTITVLAELLGYHNLCNFLLRGVILSSFAMFVLWVMLWQTGSLIDWLDTSEQPLAKVSRAFLGFSDDKRRPGIGLYQLVVDTTVWLAFVVVIIYIWDSSGTVLTRLWTQATEGLEVGNITIVPADLIGAIAVFAIIIVITGWIKRWMDRRWLEHITRDRGTRDAFTTVVGYIGFMIATVVSLSMAGVNVTGLAVIAGALSVGIGFGLQAIVNNFVSGIILLFERPIKAGDFVTVGETEGFVKRISIRSTEIETLDNQDVMVPNSELISGRVTNWVLHNPYGRLRIQVGVAYGSDVEKVKEILEEVAQEHAEVITDGRAAGPKALFMGFGDSSLDFELRVRILRIPKRFDVTSELNFAIDRRFREAGIQIPFPQRDLHVKEWPGNGGNDSDSADKPAAPDSPEEPESKQ